MIYTHTVTSKKPKKKRKAGRPKKVFDYDVLRKLAAMQCTDQEIAAFFDVSTKTVERRRKEDEAFCLVLEKGKAQGKISLRRAQFNNALRGNATMQIWLGKQLLGQCDVPQQSDDNNKHDEIIYHTMVADGTTLVFPPGVDPVEEYHKHMGGKQ